MNLYDPKPTIVSGTKQKNKKLKSNKNETNSKNKMNICLEELR
jgi:hypothetical protein